GPSLHLTARASQPLSTAGGLGRGRSALEAGWILVTSGQRRQAPDRGGCPRAALDRPDHDLFPGTVERRPPFGPERRRDRPAPVRGRGRTRRTAVPRRLRLLLRPL